MRQKIAGHVEGVAKKVWEWGWHGTKGRERRRHGRNQKGMGTVRDVYEYYLPPVKDSAAKKGRGTGMAGYKVERDCLAESSR